MWPFRRRRTYTPGVLSETQRRDDASIDGFIEADERSAIPCVMCEIDEPHACERAWWEQRYAHMRGAECADLDCLCHPETCDSCGQSIDRGVLLMNTHRPVGSPGG